MNKVRVRKKLLVAVVLSELILGSYTTNAEAESNISNITPNNHIYNIYADKINGNTGFRHYNNFTLDKGDVANLHFSKNNINYHNFVNLVDNQININGIVNTMRGNNFYNGHAIFVSPNGMVVGASGVLNVGSLSILTPGQTKFDEFVNQYNANNLANYVVGAEGYKGLIQDSQGNVIVNGQVLARNDVNLYGKNITVKKETGSPDNIGIVAGWQDTNTKFTDNKSAQNIFNSLVSNNIAEASNYALKNGKIQLVAQDTTASNVNVNNAKISANNVSIKSTAELLNTTALDGQSEAKINIDNSKIVADNLNIAANAKRETTGNAITNSTTNAQVDINQSVITNNVGAKASNIKITADAYSKADKNWVTIGAETWEIINNPQGAAKIFSENINEDFNGARSSALVNILDTQIKPNNNATINNVQIQSNAKSELPIINMPIKTSELSFYLGAIGTKTVSKTKLQNSTINTTGKVDINALSENINNINLLNLGLISLSDVSSLGGTIINNAIITETDASIIASTINANDFYLTASNKSDSELNTSVGTIHSKDTALSFIGLLNRSKNNVSASISDKSTVNAKDVKVSANSINKIDNDATAASRSDLYIPQFLVPEGIKGYIKFIQNFFKTAGSNNGIKDDTCTALADASTVFVWNKTNNTTSAKIEESTINADNNIDVSAYTVDKTRNEALSNGGETQNFGAGVTIVLNNQTNQTTANIKKSELKSQKLTLDSANEVLPDDDNSNEAGVTNKAATWAKTGLVNVSGSVIINEILNNSSALIEDSSNITTSDNILINSLNHVTGNNEGGALLATDGSVGLGGDVVVSKYTNNSNAKILNSIVKTTADLNINSANYQNYTTQVSTGGFSSQFGADGSVSVQNIQGETNASILDSTEVRAKNIYVNAGKAVKKASDGKTNEVKDSLTNAFSLGGNSYSKEGENAIAQIGASVSISTIARAINANIQNSSVYAIDKLNVISDTYDDVQSIIFAMAYSNGPNDTALKAENIRNAAGNAQDPEANLLDPDDAGRIGGALDAANNQTYLSGAGAVFVLNDTTSVGTFIENNTKIETGNELKATANRNSNMLSIIGDENFNAKVGFGAAVGVYSKGGSVKSKINNNPDIQFNGTNANKKLTVTATDNIKMKNPTIGISETSVKTGVAGSAGGSFIFNTIKPEIETSVIGTTIAAERGSIASDITSDGTVDILNIAGNAVIEKATTALNAGLTMVYNNIKEQITTKVSESELNNIGNLNVAANNNIKLQDFAIAGNIVCGESSFKFFGSTGVDYLHNIINSYIEKSQISAAGDVKVFANSETNNTNAEGTLDVTKAQKVGIGVNGDVAVNVHKNVISAHTDNETKIKNSKSFSVLAQAKNQSIVSPVGAGITIGGTGMSAANVSINYFKNTVNALASGEITSTGNVNVSALDDSTVYTRGGTLDATLPLTIINITGVVNVDKFIKTVNAKVESAIINAADVLVSASSVNSMGGTKKPDGTYDILKLTSDNYRTILLNKKENGFAQNSAFKNWNMFYDLTFGSKATGSGTVVVKNVTNTVNADVISSTINANNLSVVADDYSIKNIIAGEIDASVKGGVNGTVMITKDESTINATVRDGSRVTLNNDLNVMARTKKDNIEVVVAGGGAGFAEIHANVVTNNTKDTTTAKIDSGSIIDARNSVNVNALNDVNATRVLFSGGGSTAFAINVEPLLNSYTGTTTASIISSTINNAAINLYGHDSVTNLDIGSGISGVMQGFSGNGIAIKNVYENNISAYIDNSVINTQKNIDIATDSILNGNNWTITAGFAATGVDLVANVILNNIKSNISSYINNSVISNAGNINVTANKDKKDEIKNTTGSGTLTGKGVAAEANVIFNLGKQNNVKAYISDTQIVKSGSLNVGAYADRLIRNKNVGVAVVGKGLAAAVNTIVDEIDSSINSYIDTKAKQMNVGDVNVTANNLFKAYNNIVTVSAGAIGAGAMGHVDIENSNSIVKAEILSETGGLLNANSVNVLANDTYAMGDYAVGVAAGAGAIAGNVTLVNLGKRDAGFSPTEESSKINEAIAKTQEIYTKRIGGSDYSPTNSDASKTGAIAQIKGNVTSAKDINISATNNLKGVDKNFNLTDTLNLQNVQVGAGLVAAGVGIKRVKLANNTYAGITNSTVESKEGSINVNANTNNDVKIKTVEVTVTGGNINGNSGIYSNVSNTTTEVNNANLKAKNNVNIHSWTKSKSEIDVTAVTVAGTGVAEVSISDNTLNNTNVAKISGNTNIDADGKLTVHATNDSDLSAILRTVKVEGVQFFGMIRNFAEVGTISSAIINNVTGTFNVGNIGIYADSNIMKAYARANMVAVTGAGAGKTDSNGAIMNAKITAGINSPTGLTINNTGMTQILSGVKADGSLNALDFIADSRISNTEVSIGQLYGTALAYSDNKATVEAKLNVKEHKADSLELRAFLNENGTATFTDTGVKLLSIKTIQAETNFAGNLNVDISGNNNITKDSLIRAIHNAVNNVNLDSLNIGVGISVSVPKISSEMNSNTNVNIGGVLNGGDKTRIESRTTRTSSLDLTSKSGGTINVAVSKAINNIGGVSNLNISGLQSVASMAKGLSIYHYGTNTHNTNVYYSSGGILNIGEATVESKLETQLNTSIKDSNINLSEEFYTDIKNDNIVRAGATAKNGGFIAVSKNRYDATYNSDTILNFENSNISAGTAFIKTNSTLGTYNGDYITYVGYGGGFVTTPKLTVNNTINQSSIVNMINSAIQTDNHIEININTNTNFKQKTTTKAGGFVAVPYNENTLRVTNTQKLNLDERSKLTTGSYLRTYLDSNNNLEAYSYSSQGSVGGKATAKSYLYFTINNEVNNKGLINTDLYASIDFMGKSNNNLTQYAEVYSAGLIPISSIDGKLEESYTNKINVEKGARIEAGDSVNFYYGIGNVHRSSIYKFLSQTIFKVRANRSNYVLKTDDSLNLNGEIIAGKNNNKYMLINRDGTVDESQTKGFKKSDYQKIDEGAVITPDEQRQYYSNIVKQEMDEVNKEIDEIEVKIDVINENIEDCQKEQKNLEKIINGAPEDIRHFTVVTDTIISEMTEAGIPSEHAEFVMNGYLKYLEYYPDATFEKYLLTVSPFVIPDDERPEMIAIANKELSKIDTSNEYYTSYNKEFIITVYENEETKELYNPINNLRSAWLDFQYDIDELNEELTKQTNQRDAYIADLNELDKLKKEIEQKRYDPIDFSNSIVFKSPLTGASGEIKIHGLRSDNYKQVKPAEKEKNHFKTEDRWAKITGTGDFVVKTSGFKIDNYSNRNLIFFDKIDVTNRGGGNLKIWGVNTTKHLVDFQEFLNKPQIVSGKKTDEYKWENKGEFKDLPTTGGVHFKSTDESIIGITINNYFDALNPLIMDTRVSNIIFLDDVRSNNILNIWNESGSISFYADMFANDKANIIATQGNVLIADAFKDYKIKTQDNIYAGQNVFVEAQNFTNEGTITAGNNNRSITITNDMIAENNLIVDPTTGLKNMINLGNTKISPYLENSNNIKALYVDGKIVLFNTKQEGGSVQITANKVENKGTIITTSGYSNVNIINNTSSDIVVNNLNNNYMADNSKGFVKDSHYLPRAVVDTATTLIQSDNSKIDIKGFLQNGYKSETEFGNGNLSIIGKTIEVEYLNIPTNNNITIDATGALRTTSTAGTLISGIIQNRKGDITISNTTTDGIIFDDDSIINANGKININNAGANGIISNAVITNIGNDTIHISNTGANGTTINGAVKNTNGGDISVTNTGKLSILSDLETKRGGISINSKDGIVLASKLSTDNGSVNIQNTETDGILFDDDSIINANGNLSILNNGEKGIQANNGSVINTNGTVNINNAGANGIISNAVITNIGNDAITITNTGANGTTINGAVKNTNGGDISVTNTGKLNISSVIKTKQGDVNINSKDGITFAGTLSTNNGDVKIENTDTDGIILATASMINANGKIDVDNNGAEGIISSAIITNIGNDNITITNTGEKGTTINGTVKNTNGGNITVSNIGNLNINSLVETPDGNINIESGNGIGIAGSIVNGDGDTTFNNTNSGGIVFNYGSVVKSNGNLSITNGGADGTNIGGNIVNIGNTNIANNNGEFKLSVQGTSADDVQKGTITNTGNLDISSANGVNVAGEIRNRQGHLNITNGSEDSIQDNGLIIDQTQVGSGIVYGLIENECQGLEDSINITNYNNKGITINAQLVNANEGALNILNANESETSGIQTAVESTIRNNYGDLYITNVGKNGIDIGGHIDVPRGDIVVIDMGDKRSGIIINTPIEKESGDIALYNLGGNERKGISILNNIWSKNGNVFIYNADSDIVFGSPAATLSNPKSYIIADNGSVYITVDNGSIINNIQDTIGIPSRSNYDKDNPNDIYQTLIYADKDLSLSVTDGNIGKISNASGSIDATNIDYLDSINIDVKGEIDIYADNEYRTDSRVVNLRAKDSDLNLSSVWVDGDVILTAADWEKGDSADPATPDYYKGHSILNNSDNPLNGIVARNLTLIASDKIGTADKKLDYTQISNGIASFEAENDININMNTLDDGATLKVKDIVSKQGNIDILFDKSSQIDNIISGKNIKITQNDGDLFIRTIGKLQGLTFNDMLKPHDKISLENGVIPQTIDIAVNGDNSTLTIFNAYVKGANNGAGAYDIYGNRLADVKLSANSVISTASDVPSSNISTKKNPNGLKINMPEKTDGIVAKGNGKALAVEITGRNNSVSDDAIVSVNSDNSRGAIFNKLYSNDAYVNSKDANLSIINGNIVHYGEITNGNGSSYGNLKAVVDNDFRRLVGGRDNPVSIQLFTAKTGGFNLGMNDSIVMYTSAPIVHFEPHKLANTYSDENSFYNLGMKETSVQQNFIKHKKDEIPYKWLDEKYELTFDTDMDVDLISNVKIYRISRTGACIKNDSGLKVGNIKPINIKINKSDIDVTVNAKVVNIELDKAQVKFLDMPEDVANKIMYRYFQKANNKNIDLTYNNRKGEKL